MVRNRKPLVSIIIDNYNYAQFLPEAIGSALNQPGCATEVIVVDDGSTDRSPEIIAGYGKRIRRVLKLNGGQASAFNAGFAISRGEIIIFLDSDDVLLPNAAQCVCQAFGAQPGLVKAQYRMALIDASGAQIGVKPAGHLRMPAGDLRQHALAFPDDLPWMPTSGNAFAASSLRRIFPILESDYRILADFYLCHMTALLGPVAALDSLCACYRVHGANHHERASHTVDLKWVRQTVTYWDVTHAHLQRLAERLKLPNRPARAGDVLSVSYVANRLISLRLDPEHHPVAGDTVGRLFALGVRAGTRRFDVSWPMRLIFMAWFAAMAFAPAPLARTLAQRFLFPQTRVRLNKLLGALQRNPRAPAGG